MSALTYRLVQNLLIAVVMTGLMICMTLLVMPGSLHFSNDALAIVKQKPSLHYKDDLVPEDDGKKRIQELKGKIKPIIGAWIPYQTHLEEIQDTRQQEKGIKALLEKGFAEYYFVMTDFKNRNARELTEKLLKSADETGLKILIILLPPSEGGHYGNYDWKGWINYFNNLKDQHESFMGFTIDDFNWISTRNDTKFIRNIDYMTYSKLPEALNGKRKEVHFYPVLYFEGEKTKTVIKKYSKFTDGMILASACYYNVTNLEGNLITFSKMFDDKPTRFIVYPTTTYNYSRYGYNGPSDQLIMATLAIAGKRVDGIILWSKIDSRVIEEYLSNHDNPKYLSKIARVEKLQLRDEKMWRQADHSLDNSTFSPRYCYT